MNISGWRGIRKISRGGKAGMGKKIPGIIFTMPGFSCFCLYNQRLRRLLPSRFPKLYGLSGLGALAVSLNSGYCMRVW